MTKNERKEVVDNWFDASNRLLDYSGNNSFKRRIKVAMRMVSFAVRSEFLWLDKDHPKMIANERRSEAHDGKQQRHS